MFQKRYLEEDIWFEVTDERLRWFLSAYYEDVDVAVVALKDGQILRTPYAMYRWRNDDEAATALPYLEP